MAYIPRQFEVKEVNGTITIYSEAEFFALDAPLVIIGEPGAGKSEIVKEFASSSGGLYLRAAAALSKTAPIKANKLGQRIIIDGLDEIITPKLGSPIVEVLSKLSDDNSNFVITCRAADWQHASNAVVIEGKCQKEPVVGKIIPLTDAEIISFVNAFGGYDGKTFLKEAIQKDATELIRNPQNLIMYLEVVKEKGWPSERSGLFKEACQKLVQEENTFHKSNKVSGNFSQDELLAAAGFVFAQMLLSGTQEIDMDGNKGLSFPKPVDIASKDYNEKIIREVLSTKLFRPASNDSVESCHRTVAEYLAAQWLSTALQEQLSLNRLEELLYCNDFIVPTSLRGLHAWLATLDASNIDKLISRDPYGFFRYGDTGKLTVSQARNLLKELKNLAEFDPYFHTEHWGDPLSRGLARIELKDDILSIISDPKTPYQLSTLIIESLHGTNIVSSIIEELTKVILDGKASNAQRTAAIEALGAEKIDWAEIIAKLNDCNDRESLRVAVRIIEDSPQKYTGKLIAKTIISYCNTSSEEATIYAGLGYRLMHEMNIAQLDETLDILSKELPDNPSYMHVRKQEDVEEWVIKLLQKRLEKLPVPKPEQIWNWLKNTSGRGYFTADWDKFSVEYFNSNTKLRTDIQNIALMEAPDAQAVWMACMHFISELGKGLWLREEDIILHLKNLLDKKSLYNDWVERWASLVSLSFKHVDFTGKAREFAAEQVKTNPELVEAWAKLTTIPKEPDYLKEFREREKKQLDKRKKEDEKRQASYKSINEALVTGRHFSALHEIAVAYLGGYYNIRGDSPVARLKHLVGDDMVLPAIQGIDAVLKNNSMPSVREMTELRAKENKFSSYEVYSLVHCLILLEQGVSLDNISPKILITALTGCQWGCHWGSDISSPKIQKLLEEKLFADKEQKESFIRDTIEPYLETGSKAVHIGGLYEITHEDRFKDIAGDLAIEWLNRYEELSAQSLKYLLTAAIRWSPEKAKEIIRDKIKADKWQDDEIKGIWFSSAFLMDIENSEDKLTNYANENRDRLWNLKTVAIADREIADWPSLTTAQKYFLIDKFAPQWPPVSSPSDGWGERHPYTAYTFLQGMLNSLASDLSDEATLALKKLSERADINSYEDQLKHVSAQHRQRKAEKQKVAITLKDVRHVLIGSPPQNVDALQALVIEQLQRLEKRTRDGSTNGILKYWDDNPKNETFCRDRIAEDLEHLLKPFGVRVLTEGTMPDECSCDLLITAGEMNLPIEIKGQWHKEVWTAADNQLQDKYSREYRSEGRGIYIALWFGNIPNYNPPRIKGQKPPSDAKEFNLLLNQPDKKLSDLTKTFVLDLSKPVKIDKRPINKKSKSKTKVKTSTKLSTVKKKEKRKTALKNRTK